MPDPQCENMLERGETPLSLSLRTRLIPRRDMLGEGNMRKGFSRAARLGMLSIFNAHWENDDTEGERRVREAARDSRIKILSAHLSRGNIARTVPSTTRA